MTSSRLVRTLRRVSSLLGTTDGDRAAEEGGPAEPRLPRPDGDVPPPDELFRRTGTTGEEYLVSLLRANGGRLMQNQFVDATGWAKSTVSRLLTELERQGTVTRVRVGREKIVCLPGAEPEAAQRPFEERTTPPQVVSTR